MDTLLVNLLAMAPPSQTPGQPAAPIWAQMMPMIILLVVFWVILIRPQMKKQKEHANMLTTIKRGDKIVTNGGIQGIVLSVGDKTLSIRSADSKLDVVKSAIADITDRASGSSDSDK